MVCVAAFVLNHAETTHFRPEYVTYMQKSLRQLMSQSKLKFTGKSATVTLVTLYTELISNNFITNINTVCETVTTVA